MLTISLERNEIFAPNDLVERFVNQSGKDAARLTEILPKKQSAKETI